MNWQRRVEPQDVKQAFAKINEILNRSAVEMIVVVDLQRNPNFPLSVTLNGALFGPYRNVLLKEWVIIGSNPLAKIIERTLASVTGRHNVRWFTTEAETAAYLEKTLNP